MIAHLRGELVASLADSVIVDVGGVGYRCLVPTSTHGRLPELGQQVQLFTSLQVSEDALTLYGFVTSAEIDLFHLLLKVNGVGPKVALSVLSSMKPDAFCRAIAFEDLALLCKIPGIGKKTAQRLVLELKDKVGSLGPAPGAEGQPLPDAGEPLPGDVWAEAVEALCSLGYSRAEASQALERARKEAGESPAVESLVRLGLKHLFRG